MKPAAPPDLTTLRRPMARDPQNHDNTDRKGAYPIKHNPDNRLPKSAKHPGRGKT